MKDLLNLFKFFVIGLVTVLIPALCASVFIGFCYVLYLILMLVITYPTVALAFLALGLIVAIYFIGRGVSDNMGWDD